MPKKKVTKKQKNTIYWCLVFFMSMLLGSWAGILGIIAAVIVSNMVVDNFFEESD